MTSPAHSQPTGKLAGKPDVLPQETLIFDDGNLVLATDPDLSSGTLIISFDTVVTLKHSGDLKKTVSGVWSLNGRTVGYKLDSRVEFIASAMANAEAVVYQKSKRRERVNDVTLHVMVGRTSSVGRRPAPWHLDGTVIKDASGEPIFDARDLSVLKDTLIEQPMPNLLLQNFPTVARFFNRKKGDGREN